MLRWRDFERVALTVDDLMMETLLLPGLDGTGELFTSFARLLAPGLSPRIVDYPLYRALGYADLERGIGLPNGPFAIVAESFSGPIAVRLAARHPGRVRAIVLVASFVRSPAPILARLGALVAPLLGGTPPAFALRWWLLGSDATEPEIAETRALLRSVPHQVLARRLREIVEVDVSAEFASLPGPILFVAGTRDRLIRPRVVAGLLAVRRDMDVCFLDAPHFVLQRKPVEAAAAISHWLHAKTSVA